MAYAPSIRSISGEALRWSPDRTHDASRFVRVPQGNPRSMRSTLTSSDGLILSRKVDDAVAIGISVRHRERIRDASILAPSFIPDLLPRTLLIMGNVHHRLRPVIPKPGSESAHQA